MSTAKPSFEARAHVGRVLSLLPGDAWPKTLYLVGETIHTRGTDLEMPFRQEANFIYASGAYDIAGAALVVAARSQSEYKTTLFIPDIDPDSVMWSGMPESAEQVQARLDVDEVKMVSSLTSTLSSLLSSSSMTLYTLPWVSLPDGVSSSAKHSTSDLAGALSEARAVKTPGEISLMRRASEISSQAHADVMIAVASGYAKSENEGEAVFRSSCIRAGAKHQAYNPIIAVGTHASTLHYVDNSAPFPSGGEGALLLVDAGAEFDGYAADITRTVPVGNGGRFTKDAGALYEVVLRMQEETLAMIKPGVEWSAIHLHAHKIAAKGLLELGVLHAGPTKAKGEELVDELVRIGATLWAFPHGLGHLLGLDVHDVAGLPNGRSPDPLYRYLRLLRKLEVGWVVTVEPGLYFNEHLIAAASPEAQQYMVKDVIARFQNIGGVRIEDNVLITADGYENLTTAPKTRAAVEKLCVKAASRD